MKTNGNEPMNFVSSEATTGDNLGLTKREYFAAMAMQGLISNAPLGNLHNSQDGCALSVQWSDALINALNKADENS